MPFNFDWLDSEADFLRVVVFFFFVAASLLVTSLLTELPPLVGLDFVVFFFDEVSEVAVVLVVAAADADPAFLFSFAEVGPDLLDFRVVFLPRAGDSDFAGAPDAVEDFFFDPVDAFADDGAADVVFFEVRFLRVVVGEPALPAALEVLPEDFFFEIFLRAVVLAVVAADAAAVFDAAFLDVFLEVDFFEDDFFLANSVPSSPLPQAKSLQIKNLRGPAARGTR